MAKNITLWGANYSSVPAILLPQTEGGTVRFTDTSPTTATDADVASGKIYIKADGTQSTGTASGGGGSGGNVWQDANGYVNLDDQSGSGGSSWHLLMSYEITVNTTSTSVTSVSYKVINGIWTSDSMIFIRIRDKAGRRENTFYGSDTIYMNHNPAMSTTSQLSFGAYMWYHTTASGTMMRANQSSSPVGIYGAKLIYESGGALYLYARCDPLYISSINGTYTVEVYTLDYADGITPYD